MPDIYPHTCTNCGKLFAYEKREGDSEWYPYDANNEIGCVTVKNAPHSCGGTYDISDYHTELTPEEYAALLKKVTRKT